MAMTAAGCGSCVAAVAASSDAVQCDKCPFEEAAEQNWPLAAEALDMPA
jgi:uncharacterized protein YceK